MLTIDKCIKKREIISLFFIFIFVFFTGYILNINLYNLGLHQQINIAFDLDQAWFVDVLSRSYENWIYRPSAEETPLLIKHPLIYLFRFPVEVLQFLGYSEEISAILVSLFFISLTPILFYYCLKLCDHKFANRIILTIAFIFTSTFLANSIVLDSYSLAQFWIIATILITLKGLELTNIEENTKYIWIKSFIYLGLVGTTSYLFLFAVLCETVLIFHKSNAVYHKLLFRYLCKLFLIFSLLFIIVFIFVYSDIILNLISNPLATLKKTFWAVARPGNKEGLVSIVQIFLFFSVLSPKPNAINIENNITMIDYRALNFSYIGYFTLLLLITLYIFSFAKFYKPIVKISILWLSINLIFHLFYQERGSLFLYTGHILPVVFLSLSIGIDRFKKFSTLLALFLVMALLVENYDVYLDIKHSIEVNKILLSQ